MENILFQLQSTIILLLLTCGLIYRKQRKKHVKIMATAIIWDLILVAQIEFSRSAINKATQVMKNPALLNIHVSLAISTVIGYLLVVFLGRKLLRGEKRYLQLHKKIGMTVYVLRILTFITSFLVPT